MQASVAVHPRRLSQTSYVIKKSNKFKYVYVLGFYPGIAHLRIPNPAKGRVWEVLPDVWYMTNFQAYVGTAVVHQVHERFQVVGFR